MTDTQLIVRARTGLTPDNVQKFIPEMSSAFHSDDLLRFADRQIRDGGALQAAIKAKPGALRVTVKSDLVGDLGVNLGRGFERVGLKLKAGKTPGLPGPLRLVSDLRSATGVYVKNPATGSWETLTVYPAR